MGDDQTGLNRCWGDEPGEGTLWFLRNGESLLGQGGAKFAFHQEGGAMDCGFAAPLSLRLECFGEIAGVQMGVSCRMGRGVCGWVASGGKTSRQVTFSITIYGRAR